MALHEQCKLVHPMAVEKRRYQRLLLCDSHTSRIACDKNAASLLERRQQRHIKAINKEREKRKRKRKKEKPISIEEKQGVTRGNIDHSGSWCGSRLPCLQHQHRLLFLAMAPPLLNPPPPPPAPRPTGCNLKSPLGEAVSRRERRVIWGRLSKYTYITQGYSARGSGRPRVHADRPAASVASFCAHVKRAAANEGP